MAPQPTATTHFPHGIDTPVISVNGVPAYANVGGTVVAGTAIPSTVEPGATHFPHGIGVGTDENPLPLSLDGVPIVPQATVGATHFQHGIDVPGPPEAHGQPGNPT